MDNWLVGFKKGEGIVNILNLVVTVLLFAVLIFGITKKWNLATLLFGVSVIGLLYMTLITGGSVMGESGSGSWFFDIFEYIYSSMQSSLSGTILTVMVIFGYLEIMNLIHASDALASILAAPLSHIKSPYLLASCAIVLGAVLKIGITAGPTIAMLMLATVYPVLIASKCPKRTAAAAMFTYGCLTWGPADTACYTGISLMGLEDVSVAEWFVQNQVPVNLVMIIVAAVVFFFTSKYIDKKEGQTAEIQTASSTAGADETHKILAILPLLPLILVFVFSSLVWQSIVISVVAAVFLSIIIAIFLYAIVEKSFSKAVQLFTDFCNGMGNAIKGLGVIIIFGTVFASVLNGIGGMNWIVDSLANANMPAAVLLILICILGLVVTLVIGTFLGSISMCIPMAAMVAASTGMNALPVLQIVLLACGVGVALSPIQSGIIAISQSTGVEPLDIIKRNAAPMIIGLAAALVVTLVFYV